MRDTRSGRGEGRFGYWSVRISLVIISAIAAAGATTAAAAVGATIAATINAGIVDVTDFAIGHR